MSEKLKLEIATPDSMLASEEVDELLMAPGAAGQFGVLPGHCYMLSSLNIGELSYRNGNEVKYLALGGGYVEVQPDKVTVLAETAEFSDQIDLDRAKSALERLETELNGLASDDESYVEVEKAIERANLRIDVAQR